MSIDEKTSYRFFDRAIFVFYTLIACLAAFYISLVPLRGGDFWLLAKIGDITLQTFKIPDTLLFAFTEVSGEHFNAHEWLSAILFSILTKCFDKDYLTFVAGGFGLMLFASLTLVSKKKTGVPFPLIMLCSIVGLLCENYRHVIRPELLSLIVTAIYWFTLENIAENPKYWHAIAASLLVILWANLHGSFPIAIVLVAIYAIAFSIDSYKSSGSERVKNWHVAIRFFILTFIFLASTYINPFGGELLRFATQFGIHSEVHKYITEWLPTFDERWFSYPVLWFLVFFWALTFASLLSIRKNLRTVDWLIFAFFTFISVKAIRFPVYLCFLLPMYLPRALVVWMPSLKKPEVAYRALGLFSIATIIGCSVLGNPMGFRPLVDKEFSKISTNMENFLKDPAIHGNVLNSMELGGELIYLAYPRLKPAIDGRLDSYGLSYYQFVGNIVYQPEFFYEFIKRYDVHYIFLTHDSFIGFMLFPYWRNGDWEMVYTDNYSTLLKRKVDF